MITKKWKKKIAKNGVKMIGQWTNKQQLAWVSCFCYTDTKLLVSLKLNKK